MRVGVRRMRSAMALFRDVLPAAQAAPLREELRWIAGELGRARDLDVFFEDQLAPLRRHLPEDPALKRLQDEAAHMRAESYARLRASLESPRYAELVLRLGHWLAGRAWRQQPTSPASAQLFLPARDAARRLLARRYKRLRRRGRGLHAMSVDEKHVLRIEAKKLRYAAEFLRGLFPRSRSGRLIRATSDLQDMLGHLNDVSTARTLLGEVLERLDGEASPALVRAAGFVEGWISHEAEGQLAGLADGWRALRRQKPFWLDGV
jgi:CHAD domain-containing protein